MPHNRRRQPGARLLQHHRNDPTGRRTCAIGKAGWPSRTVPGGAHGIETVQAFDPNTGRVTQINASDDGSGGGNVASFSYAWIRSAI